MIVLVRVVGEDAVHAGANHLQSGVLDKLGIARVVEDGGEGSGEPKGFIELAEGKEPGIAGELPSGGFEDHRGAEESERFLPDSLYTHERSPGVASNLVVSTS